ncbi:MAG: ABC transporter permease [Chloroflexi bacterium]|nr:ABC transporter permease [Chloroflexota bacterium]
MVDLFLRLVKEKPLGSFSGVLVIIFFFVGIFADFLAPSGYNDIILADRLSPPSAKHILGADNLGRDLLSRIIYGARISMYVGLASSFIETSLATFIGLICGWFGGKTDITIQRFVDAWMCFPSMFIYLTVMAILGPGLTQVILVLGVAGGIRASRTIRSAVIAIRENIYLEAAKAIGAPNRRILTHHILPNIMAPVIIIFTINVGGNVMAEATLSFLGFGIPPPIPSWGGMLSGSGRTYMLQAPWMALWPGLALGIVVYTINMLGDAMRDLLDPRLRGGLGRYSGVKRKMPQQLSQA